jgi:hypothetical protein
MKMRQSDIHSTTILKAEEKKIRRAEDGVWPLATLSKKREARNSASLLLFFASSLLSFPGSVKAFSFE